MKITTVLLTLAMFTLLPASVSAEEAFRYSYLDITYVDNGLDGTVTAREGQDTIAVDIGDGDGLGLRMSFAFNDNVHVFAAYSGSNMDVHATQTTPYPSLDEMRAAMFSTGADQTWDTHCDLNDDGMVNFLDLQILYNADGDTRVAQDVSLDGDLTSYRFGIGYNQMLRPTIGTYARLFMDVRDIDHGAGIAFAGDRDFDANANGVGATLGLRGRLNTRLELDGWVSYSPVAQIDMLGKTDSEMLQDETSIGLAGEFWVTDKASIFARIEGYSDIRAWAIGTRVGIGS